jgi:hypothetical protein
MRIGKAVDEKCSREEDQEEWVVVEEHQPHVSRLRWGCGTESGSERISMSLSYIAVH